MDIKGCTLTRINTVLALFLVVVFLNLSTLLPVSAAQVIGPNTGTIDSWKFLNSGILVSDGYWRYGYVNDAYNQILTFEKSKDPTLVDIKCDWFENQSGQEFISCGEFLYSNGFRDSLRWPLQIHCPDGTLNINGTVGLTQLLGTCVGVIDREKNFGNQPGMCPFRGNPVHVNTGNKFEIETDYQSSIPGGLNYRRYYNSQLGNNSRSGFNWFSDYRQILRYNADIEHVELLREDGKTYRYRRQGNNWVSDSDVQVKVEDINDAQGLRIGWRVVLTDDTVETYENFGQFNQILTSTERGGLVTTFLNELSAAEGGDDNPRSLDAVIDPYGRTLRFQYTPIGQGRKITKITDPNGNEILYNYDASNNNLIEVIYPDDTPGDNSDNPRRIYHYEDTDFPNHLTGITDETGNRFSTYVYDNEGRVIVSEHAGGAERVTLTYNADDTTTVTDALGQVQTYTFDVKMGTPFITGISGQQCNNCSQQFASTSYDANGFVASQTDFNGNQTTFINNSRGLEESRTEAVGTSEERTITTEWHPTFRLPTKITEPGKETTFIYDSTGKLLERTETEK